MSKVDQVMNEKFSTAHDFFVDPSPSAFFWFVAISILTENYFLFVLVRET